MGETSPENGRAEETRADPLTARIAPLDQRERRKRRREWIATGVVALFFVGLTIAEIQLTRLSTTLPFLTSIFFFGLLNLNIILLITLFWLIFRNIGKIFMERRRNILGARLKTKLVLSFLAMSIIPTTFLFIISFAYINSSFDQWFSLRIKNTLQESLEITNTFYRNANQNAMHFAEHLSEQLGRKLPSKRKVDDGTSWTALGWVDDYLEKQRELLAIHSVEFYSDPMEERILVQDPTQATTRKYPRLPLDLLMQAFRGKQVSSLHHVTRGDLVRCLTPVYAGVPSGPRSADEEPAGVLVVNTYIPVSLADKVAGIASVIDDYKDTNPLEYPIKSTYVVILVISTLLLLFGAIWIGLYLARELTVPVERLVFGVQQVRAGNLDFTIEGGGHDEIAVLVKSFNRMTRDLKTHRARLTQAHEDLEKRRLQLEAILTNIGTGVIVVDRTGEIMTFNRAASQLLELDPTQVLRLPYEKILDREAMPLAEVIRRALEQGLLENEPTPEVIQWNFKTSSGVKSFAGIATPLRENDTIWGVVVVIEDMTHLIKAQREVAWREVARRIAHEIKNPLTPIKLSAQRLQRRIKHYKEEEGKILEECTQTIVQQTDALKEMVNEFSNFARFPETSPAPHDLNRAIEETLNLFSQAHPEIQFEIQTEKKIPIFEFDLDQIKRVFVNLLDNALAALPEASPTQGKVRIVSHYNEELQMAVVVVEDNGSGMPEHVRSQVFEPYFSTKKDGTGLGLAIAKRIINDHDGYIRVQSTIGRGSQFVIELPTAPKKGLARHLSHERTMI